MLARRAPRKGALFAFGWFFVALWAWADCPADRVDEVVDVAQVFDGDTVRLVDGRRLRFVGIDTPEIAHRGGRSQPYSRAAQRRLEALLSQSGQRLQLRFDVQREDHYGRLLAHPYLSDGRSVNAVLLQEGLATTLIVPPNHWQYACYRARMQQAREDRSGIWSLSGYRLTRAADLPANAGDSYRWVTGRVLGIDRTRSGIWLVLEDGLRLRVNREELLLFDNQLLAGLVGQVVWADGWLHGEPGNWRLRLRHPSQLGQLE